MESLTLTKPSPSPWREPRLTLRDLIDEWLPKLAVNAGVALDAQTQSVFRSVWLEGLGDLAPEVLRAAFQKTLRESIFWPVKVADIRKHVSRAESNATGEAAQKAWERVLEIRRVHWNPDIPGPFDRAVASLPERIRQAARASGAWREFTASEFEKGALHTWAKKRFLESFIAYGELEQDKFVLPDGEIKSLLAECAESKALPASNVDFRGLHERGLEYAERLKAAAPLLAVNRAVADRGNVWGCEETREIAYRSLGEKETSPAIADTIRAQKAALAEKGYSITT